MKRKKKSTRSSTRPVRRNQRRNAKATPTPRYETTTNDPGSLLDDPAEIRVDAALLRKAVAQNWPIQHKKMRQWMQMLTGHLEASGDELKAFLPLMKLVVELDKSNLKRVELGARFLQEAPENTQKTWNELLDLAAKQDSTRSKT